MRCRFAVEIEFRNVVQRRGCPDARDRARTFQIGDDKTACFLADKKIRSAKTIIVSTGKIPVSCEINLRRK